MKYLMTSTALALLIGFSSIIANAASNSDLELIKNRMADASFGEPMQPSELKAQYIGKCYEENGLVKTEALYWNSFVNAKGSTSDMGISTLQAYDGYALPSHLAFLLQPSQQGWDFMTNFVKNGLAGADNNLGKVTAGGDFQYLYSSQATNNSLTVSVGLFRDCSKGICNPPQLQACHYGYVNGSRVYDGCVRENDRTTFKKESGTTLISHRTAKGVGQPTNNLSFYLRPISTYCQWRKL